MTKTNYAIPVIIGIIILAAFYFAGGVPKSIVSGAGTLTCPANSYCKATPIMTCKTATGVVRQVQARFFNTDYSSPNNWAGVDVNQDGILDTCFATGSTVARSSSCVGTTIGYTPTPSPGYTMKYYNSKLLVCVGTSVYNFIQGYGTCDMTPTPLQTFEGKEVYSGEGALYRCEEPIYIDGILTEKYLYEGNTPVTDKKGKTYSLVALQTFQYPQQVEWVVEVIPPPSPTPPPTYTFTVEVNGKTMSEGGTASVAMSTPMQVTVKISDTSDPSAQRRVVVYVKGWYSFANGDNLKTKTFSFSSPSVGTVYDVDVVVENHPTGITKTFSFKLNVDEPSLVQMRTENPVQYDDAQITAYALVTKAGNPVLPQSVIFDAVDQYGASYNPTDYYCELGRCNVKYDLRVNSDTKIYVKAKVKETSLTDYTPYSSPVEIVVKPALLKIDYSQFPSDISIGSRTITFRTTNFDGSKLISTTNTVRVFSPGTACSEYGGRLVTVDGNSGVYNFVYDFADTGLYTVTVSSRSSDSRTASIPCPGVPIIVTGGGGGGGGGDEPKPIPWFVYALITVAVVGIGGLLYAFKLRR